MPVLFSVGYSGSWGQAKLSAEDFVDKAAALGFRGVMLGGKRPHLNPLDWDADARTRLRDRIARHGFERVYVAAYNNITGDLEHSEVRDVTSRRCTSPSLHACAATSAGTWCACSPAMSTRRRAICRSGTWSSRR
ncbi:MAG: hypothetical protein R2748_27135 [Bryobacterales bacterium]